MASDARVWPRPRGPRDNAAVARSGRV